MYLTLPKIFFDVNKSRFRQRGSLDAYVAALLNKAKVTPKELRFLVCNSGNTWSAAVLLIVDELEQLDTAEQKSVANDLYGRLIYTVWGYAAKTGNHPQAEQAMAVAERLHHLLGEQQQLSITWHGKALLNAIMLMLQIGNYLELTG